MSSLVLVRTIRRTSEAIDQVSPVCLSHSLSLSLSLSLSISPSHSPFLFPPLSLSFSLDLGELQEVIGAVLVKSVGFRV